jgi:hypothetical protein
MGDETHASQHTEGTGKENTAIQELLRGRLCWPSFPGAFPIGCLQFTEMKNPSAIKI